MSNKIFYALSGIFFLFSAVYLLPISVTMLAYKNQGLIPLGADLLIRGGLLYRDMFTVVWPGSFLWLALFFKLFNSTWLTCRLVLLATWLATSCLILLLSKQIIKGPLVFLPAIIFTVLAPPSYACNFYYWDALCSFLVASLVLCKIINHPQSAVWLKVLAGLLCGWSTLCYQPTGPANLLVLFIASFIIAKKEKSWQTRISILFSFLAGFLTVMLFFLAYLISTDTLANFIDCTIDFIFKHYGNVNAVFYGYPFKAEAFTISDIDLVSTLRALYMLPFSVIIWSPILTIILGAAYIIWSLAKKQAINPQLLFLFVSGSFYFTSILHRPDIMRLMWGGVLLLIVFFYLLEKIANLFQPARAGINFIVLILVLSVIVHALLVAEVYSHAKPAISTRRGPIISLNNLDIITAIEKVTNLHQSQNQKIFVYPYDSIIYFASKTSFPSIYPDLQYNFNTEQQIQSVLDDLEKSKVQYVILDLSVNNDTFGQAGFPSYKPVTADKLIVEKYLFQHYNSMQNYGHYRLLQRKIPTGY